MPIDPLLVETAISVLFGSVAGGLTNSVAVWMLFNPHERRFGFQGAIPKNKPRLARSLGRTVGERLLTPADILGEIEGSGFRATFDAKLDELVRGILDTERGSVQSLLPPAVFEEVEHALGEIGPIAGRQYAAYVETPEFADRVREFVARARRDLEHTPIGEVLTPARRAELRERASAWAEELANAPQLEQGIREYLTRHAAELLASDQPMLERIPAPVVETIERAIANYLPLAVEKLGHFLANPASRERIRAALHGLFARFIDDLRFHERVLARLMVTERNVEKMIDSLERDGVEQIAGLLEDPLVRDEIARTINGAIVEYLRKPLHELVGTDVERTEAVVGTAADYLVRVLRAERTRGFLVEKLDDVLARAEHRTWGQLLRGVEDATIAAWLLDGARSAQARSWVEQAARTLARTALTKPIGRPGRWLPSDAPDRIVQVAAPALWSWILTQVPVLVQRFDIQAMVERKVLAFSTQRVEELIRGVIERELTVIVRLGWLLGAIIGFMSLPVKLISAWLQG
ncbi:MAG TPA: DUF445 family protein [Gemmatimonadaceae bacterium]|nr:DUF445 family protein [Gemmatimonadaceae bacterium]